MQNKKMRFGAAMLIFAICLQFQIFAAGAGTGAAKYQNTMTLSEGFTYTHSISQNSAWKRVESFELESNLESNVYPIYMACDTIYGGMTVSAVTAYAESLGYNVVGAVNADFFYPATGVPCGIVIENGIFKSAADGWNALAFNADGTAFVSVAPEVRITLFNNGGAPDADNFGRTFTTTRYNKSYSIGSVFLYNSYFSTVSTRVTQDAWAVRFKILEGEMTVSGEMKLEVSEIIPECTATAIGEGYMVLTSSIASGYGEVRDMFSPGDIVTLTTTVSDLRLSDAAWAGGAGDILVADGSIPAAAAWDSAISGANPRTAVGIRADGSIVYYVVDGRSTASAGASTSQLASDMLSRDCVWAVNLDGGGSTVMSLREPGNTSNTIINVPSDGAPRRCASYILFVTKNSEGAAAQQLFANESGTVLLSGSSLDLSISATNASMNPAPVPGDSALYAERGEIFGTRYTAPATAGLDSISLYSEETGASGRSSLYIIETADSLRVSNERASTVYSVTLKRGEGRTFKAHLTYQLMEVVFDPELISFSCDTALGTITQNGVFTASGAPGTSGKVTVSAGGLSVEIPVTISHDLVDISGHWAESFIQKLYDADIVKGVSEDRFMPETGIKRGDFMLMLCRAAGSPAAAGSSGFSDVSDSAYYAGAIAWARELGIAAGYDDGTFAPEGTLTREAAFTFIHRFLEVQGAALPSAGVSVLQSFPDYAAVSNWAQEAAAALISAEIVSGSDGNIEPGQTLTRAQMAKILCVSLEKIG